MARRPTADDLATRPIINPAPHTVPLNVPLSLPVDRPQRIPPGSEAMTQWSPFGVFSPRPYFGGWDQLSQEGNGVMHVPQAGIYDASLNPWPNNGQMDRPNWIITLMRLKPTTSAHPGKAMPTGGGPTMLFKAPPPVGMQSTPIPAVGV